MATISDGEVTVELEACPDCGAMARTGTVRCAHCGTRFPGRVDPTELPRTLPVEDRPPPGYPNASPHPPPGGALGHPARDTEPGLGSFVKALLVGAVVIVLIGLVGLGGVALLGGLGSSLTGEDEALAGDGPWTSFEDPDGRFVADLPCEPEPVDSGPPAEGSVRLEGWGCAYPSATIGVTFADFDAAFSVGLGARSLLYDAPGRHADARDAELLTSTVTTVGGQEAVEYVLERDGRFQAIVAVIEENRLYFLEVESGERSPAALDRLIEGFRLTSG